MGPNAPSSHTDTRCEHLQSERVNFKLSTKLWCRLLFPGLCRTPSAGLADTTEDRQDQHLCTGRSGGWTGHQRASETELERCLYTIKLSLGFYPNELLLTPLSLGRPHSIISLPFLILLTAASSWSPSNFTLFLFAHTWATQ